MLTMMLSRTEAISCLHCGRQLIFHPERGWVHTQGGVYWMRCPDCGWEGAPYPSPARCPKCEGKGLRDDHAAIPRR
jgi:predicted RNA-binding Zn-ribbon protein involved in translation (DUF1610 family)